LTAYLSGGKEVLMFENILWANATEQAGETSLAMVEQIIQGQHNLLSNTLIALVAIAGFIAAASLVYNIYISRKKLEDIKSDIISELTEKAGEAVKGELANLKNEVEKRIKRVAAKAGRDISGSSAITVGHIFKEFDLATVLWTTSAANSNLLEDYGGARRALRSAIDELKRCKDIDKLYVDSIMENISSLHTSLDIEKKEIEEILKKLPIKSKKGR
jgi:hypothetical protein